MAPVSCVLGLGRTPSSLAQLEIVAGGPQLPDDRIGRGTPQHRGDFAPSEAGFETGLARDLQIVMEKGCGLDA